MADIIVVLVLLLILGAAVVYIVREKKRGTKCIGCPHSANCGAKNQGCGCTKNDH